MQVLVLRGYNCGTSQFHLWPPQPREVEVVYNGELRLPKAQFDDDGSTLTLEQQVTPAGESALWISSTAGLPLLKPMDYRRRIDCYELTIGGSAPSWHVRLSDSPISESSVLYSFGFKSDEAGNLYDFRYEKALMKWRKKIDELPEEDQIEVRVHHAFEMAKTDADASMDALEFTCERVG